MTADQTTVIRTPLRGPDAYDSVAQMEQRFQRVLRALIVHGYVRDDAASIEMQAALEEDTPYALLHLCDVLLTRTEGSAA